MGRINNELNHFLEDNQEFADLINLCMYHGKKIVIPEYRNLKPETGNVLAALLGSEKIRRSVEEQQKKKGETFDMCKALDDLWKDAENQGRERGLEKGLEQGISIFILDNLEEKVPKERIILKLQRRFGLEEKQADQYYARYAES